MKRSVFLPSVLLLLIIGAVHWHIQYDGDDIWFMERDLSMQYLGYRYQHWTSRVCIEAIHIFFLKYTSLTIWRLANTCVMWLCCRLLVWFACSRDRQAFGMWCMIPIALLFPLYILHTAGWGATMFNYLWPGTALLVAVLPWKEFAARGISYVPSRTAKLGMALTLPVLVLALNAEQAYMIFGALWALFVLKFYRYRVARWLLCAEGILLAFFAAAMYFSPGNAQRASESVSMFWQDFGTTSLLDKGVLSLNNMGSFFLTHEVLLLLLTAVLAWCVWQRRHDSVFRAVGVLPFLLKAGALAWTAKLAWPKFMVMPPHTIQTMQAFFDVFGLPLTHIVTPLSYLRPSAYLPLFASLLFFVAIPLAFYVLLGSTKKAFCLLVVYALGCASSFVLAFSPTLFASSSRIFFFQYLTLIGCFLACVSTVSSDAHEKSVTVHTPT